MFTGIIEEVGTVVAIRRGTSSAELTVQAPGIAPGVEVGDSVSINGVCLTAVAREGDRVRFEAVPETLRRTSLGALAVGDPVNLERALAVGQRLGGHFVQGHVDGTGQLLSLRQEDNARVLRIATSSDLLRYMVPKGSVALDGISLTLVDVDPDSFTVWIIPHTYAHTNLHSRRPGDILNIEVDLIARHIEKLLQGTGTGGVTLESLSAAGFVDE